jgi:hypothetical protein
MTPAQHYCAISVQQTMEIKQAVLSILIAVVTSVATSTITLGLGLKYYARQKWWERKAEAYQAVMDALSKMRSYNKGFVEYVERVDDSSETSEYDRMQEYKDAQYCLELHLHSDAFLLSRSAIDVLRTLDKEFNASKRERDADYQAHSDYASTKKAIDDMTTAAKRDLRIR